MGENYKKDGLEDFFHKRLQGFEEEPMSSMWGKIAAGIPAKPPLIWWKNPLWWLGGGLVLTTILFSLWQYQRIQTFEKTISQQKESIAKLEAYKQTAIQEQAAIVEAATSDLSIKKELEAGSGNEILTKKTFKKTTPKTTKSINNTDGSINNKPEIVATNTFKALMNQRNHSPVKDTIIRRRPQPSVDFLHYLPQKVLRTSSALISRKPKIQPLHKMKFYVGLQTSIFSTSYKGFISKSLAQTVGSDIVGYHISNAQNKRVDVLAGIQFDKRWSIEFGFGLSQSRLTLFDVNNFRYSAEFFDEIDIEGHPVAAYVTPSDSPPTIHYKLTNFIKNDGEDIKNGDAFTLNAFFNYNTQYLNLPLWLKFQMGQRRFHGFAKIGASWNILTHSDYQLADAELTFERISLRTASITNDALSDSFFELGISAGIEYDISQKFALALESIYYHSLSSVLSSKQDVFGLGLMAKYKF